MDAESMDVLVVEDEPTLAELTATCLEREDDRIDVTTASDAAEGAARLAEGDFDGGGRGERREAVENAGHQIYWTDRDGTIEYVNPAFEEATGFSADEAIGSTPRILKSGVHGEDFYADLWRTIRAGTVWRCEVVNETKDGERYVVDQTIAPVEGDDGEIERFVAVNVDVTE